MARAITLKRLLEKKYKLFEFIGLWKAIFGTPEKGGIWIVYGNEKNGKTLFAIVLSYFLSQYDRVDYVSAEEGTGAEFRDNVKRASPDIQDNRVRFLEYLPLSEIMKRLDKRQSAKVVVIDNITVYKDELKNGMLRRLTALYPAVTFIFLAHAERNEPFTATGVLAKKLAKIIVRIEGLTAFVTGRCPGGTITINEETSVLYHGTQILKINDDES